MTLPLVAIARRYPGEIHEERGSLVSLPDGSCRWRWADIGSDPEWDTDQSPEDAASEAAAIDYARDLGAHVEVLHYPAATDTEMPPSPVWEFALSIVVALFAGALALLPIVR